MIATLLLMFVGGIGLTQAVSDPHAVTLRWLRLGGIIAAALLGVGAIINAMTGVWRVQTGIETTLFALAAAACIIQLVTVQLAWRNTQRAAALLVFLFASAAATLAMVAQLHDALHAATQSSAAVLLDPTASPRLARAVCAAAASLSAGLLGGFLMTMLLGHAYLTAGNEMGQAPFRRLVIVMGIFLVARVVVGAGFGLVPYLRLDGAPVGSRLWNMTMITARYAVGLAVPLVFTWMTHDCVKRRANQSATGILYVAGLLVIMGEGIALALTGAIGGVF
ncbi:MAG: hypothetical protein K8S99_02320 [Planctomycetes bacterium]|nr:hypothetical protein [Planctomycetota bacterium]